MSEPKEQQLEKIISFYLGELSETEKEELQTWLNISGDHRAEFKQTIRICHRLRLAAASERATIMRENVMKKCLQRNRQKQNQRIHRLVACAAVLVLSLGAGYLFYANPDSFQKDELQNISILQANQGGRIAVLRSASGQEWTLSNRNTIKVDIGENVILKGDSLLPADKSSQEIPLRTEEYHVLTVPQGGEYNVTLTDGTNVWLNSDSELKFPAHFTGNTREVYLNGEAFFEVVSDSLHPFIVRTGEADIRVTGTSFNVINYAGDKRLEVALQKGKVEFTATATRQVYPLKPGHVVTMNKENAIVCLDSKDVTLIGAWRSGYFYFEDMPLEELVVKLERWYQVRFVFADEETKQLRFTGAVKKYCKLDDVLKIIEKTKDIAFTDFGEEVRIIRK